MYVHRVITLAGEASSPASAAASIRIFGLFSLSLSLSLSCWLVVNFGLFRFLFFVYLGSASGECVGEHGLL